MNSWPFSHLLSVGFTYSSIGWSLLTSVSLIPCITTNGTRVWVPYYTWLYNEFIFLDLTFMNEKYLSLYLWFYSPCGPWPLFKLLNLFTVSRTLWTQDQPVARLLPTHRTTPTQNKCTETSIPWVGFKPTIPLFKLAKTVHALDHASPVIGMKKNTVTFIII
jgi:hypothetical protein